MQNRLNKLNSELKKLDNQKKISATVNKIQ